MDVDKSLVEEIKQTPLKSATIRDLNDQVGRIIDRQNSKSALPFSEQASAKDGTELSYA